MRLIILLAASLGAFQASAAVLDSEYNSWLYSDRNGVHPNYIRMLEADGSAFFMDNTHCGQTSVYRFDGAGKLVFRNDIFSESWPCTSRNAAAFLRTSDGGYMYAFQKGNQWNDGVISTVIKIDAKGAFVRSFGQGGKLPLGADKDLHAPTKIIYAMNELGKGRVLVGMNMGCGAAFSVLDKNGRWDRAFGEKPYLPFGGEPPCWEWPRLTVPFVVVQQNAVYMLHKRALIKDKTVYAAVTKWDLKGNPDLKYGQRDGINLIPLLTEGEPGSRFNPEDSFALASSGNFLFRYSVEGETNTRVIELDPKRDFAMKAVEIQPPAETALCTAGSLETIDESADGTFFALFNPADKVKPKAPKEMCSFVLQQLSASGTVKQHEIRAEELGEDSLWNGRPTVGPTMKVDGSNRVYVQIGNWQRTQPLR